MRNKNTRLVLHRGILESSHQMQHWNEAHRLGATGKDIHWINMYLILCFDRLRRSLAVHTTFCSSVGSQGRWSWSLHQNYSVQHFAPANVTQFIVVHLITFTVEEETYNQQQKKNTNKNIWYCTFLQTMFLSCHINIHESYHWLGMTLRRRWLQGNSGVRQLPSLRRLFTAQFQHLSVLMGRRDIF